MRAGEQEQQGGRCWRLAVHGHAHMDGHWTTGGEGVGQGTTLNWRGWNGRRPVGQVGHRSGLLSSVGDWLYAAMAVYA